jgi:hypothetical protein
MPDWQVTATKIYCDAVDDDVTVIVYQDLSTTCTGYKKYVTDSTKATARTLSKKAGRLGRDLKCEGPEDFRVTRRRDELIDREKMKTGDVI